MYRVIEAQQDYVMQMSQQWKVIKFPMSIYMHAFMISYLA